MTVASLAISAQPLLTISADVLVLAVLKTSEGPRIQTDDPELQYLQSSLAAIGVTGAEDEIVRVVSSHDSFSSIALVGLGSSNITAHSLRYAAGSAARQLRGIASLVFGFPADDADSVLAVLEGAGIGAYSYLPYRVASLAGTMVPAHVITVASAITSPVLVERATAIAEAIHTVRDLVNSPPNDLYPETFAAAATALSEHADVAVEVLGVAELAEGGFGGILGVGLGSTRGPRLVKMSYAPPGAARHIALVGKGITFDSGGLSLKPPASMIGMKYDMTGAATVLAVTLAIARLALPVRVTAWLCLAENLPSGSAMRPNDVITARGGKTIEVLNTDAEGRLVLADGIAAASEEHPDAIIDVATLTGAAVVALGTRYVGTMGDSVLAEQIVEAGNRVGETLWHMPIASELRPLLASDLADIANIKPGNTAGGMMIAAAFLREFVGTQGQGDGTRPIPWAHLDIAGPANNGGAGWGFTGKGPTGVSVRALIELAEEFSRS